MLPDVLTYTRQLLQEVIPPGGHAVDATMGNGHDTVFLASCTGPEGRVTAFDVQEQALRATAERLEAHGLKAELVQRGHEHAGEVLGDLPLHAAVFNLGYLPRSDKTVTTRADSTIAAVQQLFDRLVPGGRIVLVIYHGHEEGQKEKEQLLPFLEGIPQDQAAVLQYAFMNQRNAAPFVTVVEKR
ncbi:tRNA (mnm(5)s(2)U34)-methyltransferase [Alkalicoccus chagannorensis]|uniref:tRNA (mnm(5)s(2)U34)-methyltransferase n=1 Tax=Alkalicoccus chagannorensis TaxID=427072 RepID=UPI00040A4E7F|nr:class I SAM-dependent methyltransferase [Alkalicoccus chagannorensis]